MIELHASGNQKITTMHGTTIKLAFKTLNSGLNRQAPSKKGYCANDRPSALLLQKRYRCRFELFAMGHSPPIRIQVRARPKADLLSMP
jgi:hypothetical protein